jgi:hypothetical protein
MGLVGLTTFILRDVLFFGRAFFERDLAWSYAPEVEAMVRAFGEGALPLRDATIGFGQTLIGNPDAQVLYPLAWLNLFLLPDQAYSLMVLAHFLIGASGAASLAWRLSASRWSSFFAGAFWIASGPFQSLLNLWHHFASAAWMPWVLFAFDRLLQRPSARRMAPLGLVFGIQILAGSAEVCAMTVLLALLRLLCEGRALVNGFPRRAGMIVASLAIAAGLGAGVWLSALEIVRTSRRLALPREVRTDWSVHPLMAVELAVPTLIGGLPLNPETTRLLSDGRPPFLASLFLGVLAVPLCVAGLLNTAVSRQHRLFLIAGALVAGLVALGKYAPFYDLAVALLPPLALFRYPIKATVPASLLLSVLAGLGVRRLGARESRIAGGICVLMILIDGALFFGASELLLPLLDPSRPGVAAQAIGTVASTLLWSCLSLAALGVSYAFATAASIRASALLGLGLTLVINRDINATVPRSALRFRPENIQLLRDPEPSRLYAFPYSLHPEQLPDGFSPRSGITPEAFVTLIRRSFMSPTGSAWNLEYGWDVDQRGLLDRVLARITAYMNAPPPGGQFLRLLRLGNVTRVVDFYTTQLEGLTLERTIALGQGRSLYVYRVSDALPRAYAVSGSRPLDLENPLPALLDSKFDPRAEILVSDGPMTRASPSFAGSVAIQMRRSDRIELEADLNGPGYVVLLEGFLPGWRVTVDGESKPVRRANALFLAAETPAGRHRVVFTYRPTGALIGIATTAISALAMAAFLLYLRSRAEASWPED